MSSVAHYFRVDSRGDLPDIDFFQKDLPILQSISRIFAGVNEEDFILLLLQKPTIAA